MNYKQIILIRSDLDMRCGKKCVQIAHASLMGADSSPDQVVKEWKKEGMRKIVLKVKDLEHLFNIWDKAVEFGISGSLVRDFGLTQLEPDTITCIGFAPYNTWEKEGQFLDSITNDLSLL